MLEEEESVVTPVKLCQHMQQLGYKLVKADKCFRI